MVGTEGYGSFQSNIGILDRSQLPSGEGSGDFRRESANYGIIGTSAMEDQPPEFDIVSLPTEEFRMEFVDMPDGSVEARFHITGRTRELVKLQAARHGMEMQEWLTYCLRRDLPANDR